MKHAFVMAFCDIRIMQNVIIIKYSAHNEYILDL